MDFVSGWPTTALSMIFLTTYSRWMLLTSDTGKIFMNNIKKTATLYASLVIISFYFVTPSLLLVHSAALPDLHTNNDSEHKIPKFY